MKSKVADGLNLRRWGDIKILIKRIKFLHKYGYLPMAHYEGFNWFIDTMKDILTFYRDERTSDPWVIEDLYCEELVDKNHNKVTEDFNQMICCLEKMDESNYNSFVEGLKQMKESKEKFFKLFSKYFYYLWD